MNYNPPPLVPTKQVHGVPMPSLVNGQVGGEKHGAFTLQQIQQLYHQQLLQQINEADTARNELSRVRAQLKVEMDARSQAQQQVHRLLAQNREMLVMIQRLMSQVSDKYAKDNNEPLNETWILSELSSNFSMNSSSNLYKTDSLTNSNLLGSRNIDFSSQVFDNSNIGPSPSHKNVNVDPITSPFKGAFNPESSGISSQNGSISTNGGFTSTQDIESNVKASNPFASDAYKLTFGTSFNSSHIPHQTSLNSTMNSTDMVNNNGKSTLIQ